MRVFSPLLLLLLCNSALAANVQDTFFKHVSSLCGQTLIGAVTKDEPKDPAWSGQTLSLTFKDCSQSEVAMELSNGNKKPLLMILRRASDNLQLEHRHQLPGGGEGNISRFGGRTKTLGTSTAQTFRADAISQALFIEQQRPQATHNVWTLRYENNTFTYQLTRPGRTLVAIFHPAL
ncbi:hypothetical protein [Gallaecimonas mangrovi]|uniref:hypothetical protein n=1 Tax=Gallaecimonas mangrovi TaxID=2291597 RepID=UPI000E2008DB|nr:hypothetical protein [Gallaecimonas mangrovi]